MLEANAQADAPAVFGVPLSDDGGVFAHGVIEMHAALPIVVRVVFHHAAKIAARCQRDGLGKFHPCAALGIDPYCGFDIERQLVHQSKDAAVALHIEFQRAVRVGKSHGLPCGAWRAHEWCELGGLSHVFAFGEFLNSLGTERGKIVGIAAGNESLVADAFLVDPRGTGIFQIGSQAGPGGHFSPAKDVGLD